MSERGGNSCKMVHVINVEIKDNHDDATLGAFVIHELVKEVCLRIKKNLLKRIHCVLNSSIFGLCNPVIYICGSRINIYFIFLSIFTNFISP